ncbi:MAG: ribonuclease HIII [Candidatus Aminicenantales bacterium]|jgi:ribonuclease HIII
MSQAGLFPPASGHIGTDESGKGDYFGPLVIAGFYGPDDQGPVLREMGVRDSKALSDNRVRDIAASLRKAYVHSIVVVGPEKYNELYEKLRNLNKLLAWGHARVIENILDRIDCAQAVTDQFGDERFVLNALMRKGRTIELIQRPRGEEDAAVAAASILARAEFVRRLEDLSTEWGVDLHKGAGPPVEAAAAVFLRRHGAAALPKVAKMHFKITERVLRLF